MKFAERPEITIQENLEKFEKIAIEVIDKRLLVASMFWVICTSTTGISEAAFFFDCMVRREAAGSRSHLGYAAIRMRAEACHPKA